MEVIKSTKEVIDALLADGDVRGIANPGNWHDARPVTLSGILNDVVSQYPEIMWIVPVDDEEDAPEPVKGESEEAPDDGESSHEDIEECDSNMEPYGQEESEEPAAVEDDDTVEYFSHYCKDKKCPWYDGLRCNSPNGPGLDKCDYDRGILPGWDDDETPDQEAETSEPEPEETESESDTAADDEQEACDPDGVDEFANKFEDYVSMYGSKALTTNEAKECAYKMLDDGFTLS